MSGPEFNHSTAYEKESRSSVENHGNELIILDDPASVPDGE